MNRKWIAAMVGVAVLCLASLVAAAGKAGATGGPPSIAAGPAFGFIPSHNANHGGGGHGRTLPLLWHNGPVMHNTTVNPIFWGTSWGNPSFTGDKVTGLDTLYSGIGGTSYAHTNSEYTDSSGPVNTTSITKGSDRTDLNATPSGAPTTNQVLAEVASVTNNHPTAGAYYPVYSDQPRGSAGYCAWHSSGTIGGIQVEFGFFFNLDGDPGCDPQDSSGQHSQGLAALANVSGHELSETLTDPQLNAWYDQQGAENADKCAWKFSGLVSIGGQSWKIQGNWSNAAAANNSGYANGGCIQTS
ncbi:MAG TPA: hypothetical protein VH108_06665 [Gaiellaceae bacterium]|jgi:hypothetical protein|nr:hypothetical protein [Gaiellaceae bacterium]